MKTYLLLWTPKKWVWESLEADIRNVNLTGRSSQRWSCGVTKSIRPGDRIFLLRLGEEPKGIVGAGFAFTGPFRDQHWSGDNRDSLFIEVDFLELLNAEKEPILKMDMLEDGELKEQNWHPQASGTSVKEHLVEKLEAIWFDFLKKAPVRNNPFLLDRGESQKTYTEGAPTEVSLTRYERNPYARKRCIEHYGHSCCVCGFNFEQKYGEYGRGFIHVHHLEQLADIGKTYTIDPIADLRPVCANCHAIIHRKQKALTIDEAKNLVR